MTTNDNKHGLFEAFPHNFGVVAVEAEGKPRSRSIIGWASPRNGRALEAGGNVRATCQLMNNKLRFP